MWWHTRGNQISSFDETDESIQIGGRQFSRLLAAEVCASAVIILYTPCSEVVWRVLATPLYSPFSTLLPLPFVTVCHNISSGVYIHIILFVTAYSTEGITCNYNIFSSLWWYSAVCTWLPKHQMSNLPPISSPKNILPAYPPPPPPQYCAQLNAVKCSIIPRIT
jgi:hypothetical protein